MGVFTPIAVRHAKAHFRPPPEPTPEKPKMPTHDTVLHPAMRARLEQSATQQFQAILQRSASKFQFDLEASSEQIDGLVKRLAGEIVAGEMERYRLELHKLHQQADTDMGNVRREMANHESELKTKFAQEMEAEKQRLIKQIDTRLGDAVASFLIEVLGHNVDLGSQAEYLVGLLEEHKAEFIKEVDGKGVDNGTKAS